MNILAIDTSGNACCAAVLKDEQILSEVFVNYKKTHSETLAPMIDYCLAGAGLDIKDIDLFCCAVGPGSFTGLRIGIGMIKAFSHASSKPTVGVNTLDALARNAKGTEATVCPIIDARRGDVYTASYKNGKRITDYRGIYLDTVLKELKGENTVFLGDAATNYKNKILDMSSSFSIAHSGIIMQRASSVGLAAYELYNNKSYDSAHSLEPFYLRETQAERVFAEKQSKKV